VIAGKRHRSRGAIAPESFGRSAFGTQSEGARDAGGRTDPRAPACRHAEADADPGRERHLGMDWSASPLSLQRPARGVWGFPPHGPRWL